MGKYSSSALLHNLSVYALFFADIGLTKRRTTAFPNGYVLWPYQEAIVRRPERLTLPICD